jgi:hypothetical protein
VTNGDARCSNRMGVVPFKYVTSHPLSKGLRYGESVAEVELTDVITVETGENLLEVLNRRCLEAHGTIPWIQRSHVSETIPDVPPMQLVGTLVTNAIMLDIQVCHSIVVASHTLRRSRGAFS